MTGFFFDGHAYAGRPGDTLAAALLRAGVRTVARGIGTGRPRGVFSAGVEEPNAFVQVDSGGSEPMLRATQVELNGRQRDCPRLAVVMPCYNEELVIGQTLARLGELLRDLIIRGKIDSER